MRLSQPTIAGFCAADTDLVAAAAELDLEAVWRAIKQKW
jgi:hypothetical protein